MLNFKSQTSGQGERGRPGVGFNLTSDGNYDMLNKKLANVGEGTASNDAITKHQLDTAMTDKHDNIDLKDTYNVINSKRQTFNEMKASRNTLVCYEGVRDVFVSRKESIFPMAICLDMGNNYIYNVKTPISGNQGANKSYVDQHVPKAGDTMSGDLNMDCNKIKGLPTKGQAGDETTSNDYGLTIINSVSSVFLDHAGSLPMTGSLHMGNKNIINLANPTNNADAVNKAYVDTGFLKLSGGT